MKKKIKNLDLEVVSTKLDNGLEIYIVPKNNINNTYVTYTTRYGGINNEFVPINSSEMIKVPMGIAHFLEHKMFEQEDGSDVFNFFSSRGSDANANTNSLKTTYLFSGPNAFYDNLEFLLSYVEKPYFTDENIEKEKGIIIQEIKMYEDRPYSKMYNKVMYNTFINSPFKYPVIGTIDSVNSITKENLYDCYNTFYNPSNMFIVVTGNVDPNKTIKLIKNHESKRKIKYKNNIKLKEYNEPDSVYKKYERIKMDVTIPKVAIGYKISIKKFRKLDSNQLYAMILNAFDLKLGATSLFNERLRNEGIITAEIELLGIKTPDHILVMVLVETKKYEKIVSLVNEELKNLTVTEEELIRRKRTNISDLILMSDNIFAINSKIMSDIITKNKINYDPIKLIRNAKTSDINNVLSKVSLENYTVLVVDSIDNKK